MRFSILLLPFTLFIPFTLQFPLEAVIDILSIRNRFSQTHIYELPKVKGRNQPQLQFSIKVESNTQYNLICEGAYKSKPFNKSKIQTSNTAYSSNVETLDLDNQDAYWTSGNIILAKDAYDLSLGPIASKVVFFVPKGGRVECRISSMYSKKIITFFEETHTLDGMKLFIEGDELFMERNEGIYRWRSAM